MLLEVYNKAQTKPDAQSKARVLAILRAFPAHEPTKRKFVNEAVAWSAKLGEFPAGDGDVHHVAGSLYADGRCPLNCDCGSPGAVLEGAGMCLNRETMLTMYPPTEDEPYDAERHLILGTKDSAETLAKLEYAWYAEDESHTAPIYAARAVLPYLLVGNLRAANKSFLIFTSQLSSSNPGIPVQQVSSSSSDLRVYPSLPLLNFLGLLLLAVQRGDAGLFRMLKAHYAAHLKELEGAWDEALAQVGEMYFGIRIPSQSNPFMEMMGNMLMGGGGAGKKKADKKKIDPPSKPGTPGLD
jgi:golgi to ER traffic protein 4